MAKPNDKNAQNHSLAEVHETVAIPRYATWWRRWFAVTGPALMAAVGYMDPGNWATDLAAGSRYNYTLIWVLLMSNLMAILLQSLSARLGIVARRDLAQASHESYPQIVNIPLYILAEIAITATDLAEVLGSAIALNLLFGLPLIYGVLLTALDTLLLLLLSHFGIRKLEAVVLALVGTIGAAFVIEIFLSQPDWHGIAQGFVPSIPDATALYIAVGMLGATVMPHNLYLHSALVQTRKIGRDRAAIKDAIRWNTIDSAVALNLAFFINAAILIMAAAVFYRHGLYQVAEIQDAYRLLEPLVGASIAPIAFAIALLASGQSSTITGTLAGQIVMEGYLNLRIRPWLRRLITRTLAITPAIFTILYFGEDSTGQLLVLSQVVLSLQLPFAVIPLIHFVADKRRMGHFAIKPWIQTLAWLIAIIIILLNANLVREEVGQALATAGERRWLLEAMVIPFILVIGILLFYVTFRPWLPKRFAFLPTPPGVKDVHGAPGIETAPIPDPRPYRRVAIALDFGGEEEKLLAEGLRIADREKATIHLLHVVESPAARMLRLDAEDIEVKRDLERLRTLAEMIQRPGMTVEVHLGAGDPAAELARLAEALQVEIIIVGAHGHSGVSDLVHGATVNSLRHRTQANVLVVRLGDAENPERSSHLL